MSLYFKFISMSFQKCLAYRVEYVTGVLNAFLYIFIFTSVWRSLVPPGTEAGTFQSDELVVYAVLSTLIKVSFARSEGFLSSRVRTGEIAVYLTKPFSFPLVYLCDVIGNSLFQLMARAFPLFIFAVFFFSIRLPVTTLIFVQFIPVYLFSFVIFFAINFLISSLSLFFVDIYPFWFFYFALVTLTSGAIIPVDFFPVGIKHLLNFTPFPYLFYYPTMILLGKATNVFSYPELLGSYMLMSMILLLIGNLIYYAGIRKLTVAGG